LVIANGNFSQREDLELDNENMVACSKPGGTVIPDSLQHLCSWHIFLFLLRIVKKQTGYTGLPGW